MRPAIVCLPAALLAVGLLAVGFKVVLFLRKVVVVVSTVD
jgi:hypothetical protein